MTFIRCTGRGSVLAALVALGGCAASGSPVWDAQFGDSVRQLAAQQTANPQAAKRETAEGQDGRSAREAHDRYVESFTAPPTSTVINIGIGGGGR